MCARNSDGGGVRYQLGIPRALRMQAAELYDSAFGAKFSAAIPNAHARRALFAEYFCGAYAFVAIDETGLLGIAGFDTGHGSLTGGVTFATLRAQLGWIRAARAFAIFCIYARSPSPRELVMDGIAVRSDARGRGIGGGLLDEIANYARAHDFARVRLDVIDTNPRAQKLYLRKGFVAVHTERFAFLRPLLKFGAATRMELQVE